MLDQGVSLRCVFMWVAWGSTAVVLIAWAVIQARDIAVVGVLLITVACTMTILNDNAKTRRCARACMREIADDRGGGPLTPVR